MSFDIEKCEIEPDTGHLLCPKSEAPDFEQLQCKPRNELENDGITIKQRNASASDDIEVV